MIEFSGELSGNAKLFYLKNIVKKLQFLFIIVSFCITPLVVFFAYRIGVLRFIWVYPFVVVLICLLANVLSKKGNKDMLIKRVYVENKHIFSETSTEKYKLKICSVKKIVDYGEFYFVKLSPFLPVPDIVCQKNLLSKGSLKEFETLLTNQGSRPIRGQTNQGTVL